MGTRGATVELWLDEVHPVRLLVEERVRSRARASERATKREAGIFNINRNLALPILLTPPS